MSNGTEPSTSRCNVQHAPPPAPGIVSYIKSNTVARKLPIPQNDYSDYGKSLGDSMISKELFYYRFSPRLTHYQNIWAMTWNREREKAYWKRIIVFACRQSNLFIMTTSLLTSFISYQNMAYFKHSYVGVKDRLRFFLDRKNIFGRNRYFSLLCFHLINKEWLLQT